MPARSSPVNGNLGVKVVCVGGGPAGLYLAILLKLHDPGIDVTVFDRVQADSVAGWGVTLGAFALSRLTDRDPVSARAILDAALPWSDQVTHIRGKQVRVHADDPACTITRRRLLDILAHRARDLGVRIEYGTEVTAQSGLPEADLVVAADGVNSQTREGSGDFSTRETLGRNKYIWLGTTKVFEEFNFLFVSTDSGWIWAHAYGIDAGTSTFIVECQPETWTGLGFDAMSTQDALRILEKIFGEHLDGHPLIGEPAGGSTTRWLNFRSIVNERWYIGNVVLVGDSAHTTHFSIGRGTALAIEDAAALADSIHEHDDVGQALQAYERRRKAELAPIQSEAHCSATWLENISRYIDRKPRQFSVLLSARRSPLTLALPPAVTYLLRCAVERFTLLEDVRQRAAPTVRVLYRRRRLP
jgi:2-polyprenyl-6-methoxyphenol hydroxylase-like FAD-dependent oxidoreductase